MYRLKETPAIQAVDFVGSPLQNYINAVGFPIDKVIASAAVFRTLDGTARILLLQRSESDSLPGQWELPGGSVDATDATLRDAVARELKEETGLTLAWIVADAGRPERFMLGRRRYVKLSFVVEVDEVARLEYPPPPPGPDGAEPNTPTDDVPVILNPSEHQRHIWIARQEAETMQYDGQPLQLTSSLIMRDILLQAFDVQHAVLAARQDCSA